MECSSSRATTCSWSRVAGSRCAAAASGCPSTSGCRKAGVLTHGQMAFVVTNHLADLIPGTTERDCSIAVAPLSHGAGIHALLNVARGAATVLMPGERLDPEAFWHAVEKHRVSN